MSELSQYIGTALAVVLVLGTMNVFFIMRLVNKIEDSSDTIIDLKSKLQNMVDRLECVPKLHMRMSSLERDIAVLQVVAKHHHPETMEGESK